MMTCHSSLVSQLTTTTTTTIGNRRQVHTVLVSSSFAQYDDDDTRLDSRSGNDGGVCVCVCLCCRNHNYYSSPFLSFSHTTQPNPPTHLTRSGSGSEILTSSCLCVGLFVYLFIYFVSACVSLLLLSRPHFFLRGLFPMRQCQRRRRRC